MEYFSVSVFETEMKTVNEKLALNLPRDVFSLEFCIFCKLSRFIDRKHIN